LENHDKEGQKRNAIKATERKRKGTLLEKARKRMIVAKNRQKGFDTPPESGGNMYLLCM